ncbi:DEAD/DEAH box helicase [Halosquirtibacter laminarini]|uniref:DEAD/DEAH box helicase n=1 Tax=Halosquirtibacter laminarini TaxID=3374600 RepID=A0AC61NHM3_9BACT|nr:DEAD/DEAH box helicase [Prolixibacteraceae bacterium]
MENVKEFLLVRSIWCLKLKREKNKNYSVQQVEQFIADLLSIRVITDIGFDSVSFKYTDWETYLGEKLYNDKTFGDKVFKGIKEDQKLKLSDKVLIASKFCTLDFSAAYFLSSVKREKNYWMNWDQRDMFEELFVYDHITTNEPFLQIVLSEIAEDKFKYEHILYLLIDNIINTVPWNIIFRLIENVPKLKELKVQALDEFFGASVLVGNKTFIQEIKNFHPLWFDEYALPWFDDLSELKSIPILELNRWTNTHMVHNSKKLFVPGYRGLFIAFVLVRTNDDSTMKALLTLANDGIKEYKDGTTPLEDSFLNSYKFLRFYARTSLGKELGGKNVWRTILSNLDTLSSSAGVIGILVAKWLGYHELIKSVIESQLENIYSILDEEYVPRILVEYDQACAAINKKKKFLEIFSSFNKHDYYDYQFLQQTEPWNKALKLILKLSEDENKHNNACLMWVIRNYHYYGELAVYERTQGKIGLNKGRKLSFSKLKSSPPASATPLDLEAVSCYEEASYRYGNESIDRMLYALRRHPHVYADNDYANRVDIVEYPFILEILKKGNSYRISANQEVLENYSYHFINNTKISVTKASELEIKFSKILVESGGSILVPEGEWDVFQQVLKGLSTKLFIDGDPNESTVTVQESISAPIVQMRPVGKNLRVDFLLKHHDSQTYYSKIGGKSNDIVIDGDDRSFLVRTDIKKEDKIKKKILNTFKEEAFHVDKKELSVVSNDVLESLELLSFVKENFQKWPILWPEGESFKLSDTITEKELNIDIVSNGGWFEVSGQWKVDNEKVYSLLELMQRSNGGHQRFIKLDEDHYVTMNEALQKKIQQISALGDRSMDDQGAIRIHPMLMQLFDDWIEGDAVSVPNDCKEMHAKIQNLQKKKFALTKDFVANLRSYQEDGFQWMCRLYELGLGACLADDMGLGKTIQILAILDKYKSKGPSVVVAPSSVCLNWEKEIARFAPTLDCKLLPLKGRKKFIESLSKGDVLIVSYGVLQSNTKLLEKTPWNVMVLDEAHAIKNNQTSRSKAVMDLDAKFRIAATGTPVQNHLGELWNLFQFLIPGLLGNYKSFQSKYMNGENANRNKEVLKKLLTPFMLRRTKGEVLKELPEKTEVVREIEFSSEEKVHYEACRIAAQQNIDNSDPAKVRFQILSEITRLRQACLSGSLVNSELTIDSSKLAALESILYSIVDGDHKVLVFSQFTSYLKIIEEKISALGYDYCYLDGRTTKAKRAKQIQLFQEGSPKIFLISLKAGGLGLNLTAADYVIHMDPWWNPAIEDQATDRAHRMGQEKPVTVYRLITKGTIEEKIIALHETKRELADHILEGNNTSSPLDLDELKSLLQ